MHCLCLAAPANILPFCITEMPFASIETVLRCVIAKGCYHRLDEIAEKLNRYDDPIVSILTSEDCEWQNCLLQLQGLEMKAVVQNLDGWMCQCKARMARQGIGPDNAAGIRDVGLAIAVERKVVSEDHSLFVDPVATDLKFKKVLAAMQHADAREAGYDRAVAELPQDS